MEKVKKIFFDVFDVFFPRPPCVLLVDSLPETALEKYAVLLSVHSVPHCIALLPYKHTLVQNVIHATKYHGSRRAPKLLVRAIAPHVAEELSERSMFGTFYAPLLTAVPLHKKRLGERGYNQSERLAEVLFKELSSQEIEMRFDVLAREKHTLSQAHTVSKKERLENMKSAFTVPHPELVLGKDVILLDDVVTTGATFLEVRRALLKAGAREVLCIAVAH